MGVLSGRVAWVTGGGRGIGRAAALALARTGARVAVSARTRAEVEDVAAEARDLYGSAEALTCDVADWSQVIDAVGRIESTLGPVDILINNAGVLGPLAPMWTSPPRDWARAIEINLIGAYHCARAVLPGMIDRRRGSIVNVSSGAADFAVANWTAYAASKAGLDHLTRTLGVELDGTGVHVNSLHPGVVETDMMRTLRTATPEQLPEHRRRFFQDATAKGDVAPPEIPAVIIAWLASDAARDLNGQVLNARDNPSLVAKARAALNL